MPEVSVVIATYNRAPMLGEAIQSVSEQTYPEYEVIVVDDGSTDNTREVVSAFPGKVRYVFQQNRGRSAARNHGIGLAQGRYVAFLDSDDMFAPHKLAVQVSRLNQDPEAGMVYSAALNIDERGKEIPFVYEASASGWIYREVAFYVPLTITLPTVMIRTEVLRQVGGFDESMDRFEDTDMWRRVAKRYPIIGVAEPLSTLRTHSGNTLQDPARVFKQISYYVRKVVNEDREFGPIFIRRGAARLYGHYGCAVALHPKWRTVGRTFLLQSLKYWPLDARVYLHLANSCLGGRLLPPLHRIRALWPRRPSCRSTGYDGLGD
jgi:glycosyltransferase involved in cell wall biosynthesis